MIIRSAGSDATNPGSSPRLLCISTAANAAGTAEPFWPASMPAAPHYYVLHYGPPSRGLPVYGQTLRLRGAPVASAETNFTTVITASAEPPVSSIPGIAQRRQVLPCCGPITIVHQAHKLREGRVPRVLHNPR